MAMLHPAPGLPRGARWLAAGIAVLLAGCGEGRAPRATTHASPIHATEYYVWDGRGLSRGEGPDGSTIAVYVAIHPDGRYEAVTGHLMFQPRYEAGTWKYEGGRVCLRPTAAQEAYRGRHWAAWTPGVLLEWVVQEGSGRDRSRNAKSPWREESVMYVEAALTERAEVEPTLEQTRRESRAGHGDTPPEHLAALRAEVARVTKAEAAAAERFGRWLWATRTDAVDLHSAALGEMQDTFLRLFERLGDVRPDLRVDLVADITSGLERFLDESRIAWRERLQSLAREEGDEEVASLLETALR